MSNERVSDDWLTVQILIENDPKRLACLRELQQRREAERWIPCAERLPDEGMAVLVFAPELASKIDRWGSQCRKGLRMWGMWIVEGINGECEVTHWYATPTPPITTAPPTEVQP